MSAETTDHEAELEKLCERLEANTSYIYQDGPTQTLHRNPDGPEAARLLREMAAENERLKAVVEGFVTDLTGSLRNRETMLTINHAALTARIKQALALTKGKPHD